MTSDEQFFPVTDYIKWKPFVVRDDPPKKALGGWLKEIWTAFPPAKPEQALTIHKFESCHHAEIVIPPHP